VNPALRRIWQIQVWQLQFGTPAAAIIGDVFGDSGRLTWHFTFSRDGAWPTCRGGRQPQGVHNPSDARAEYKVFPGCGGSRLTNGHVSAASLKVLDKKRRFWKLARRSASGSMEGNPTYRSELDAEGDGRQSMNIARFHDRNSLNA
jgi:hypothetical protein